MKILFHLYNVWTYIRCEPELSEELQSELDYHLSFEVMGAEFAIRNRQTSWDGRRRFYSGKLKRFPTGLIDRAVSFFVARGIPVEFVEYRARPTLGTPLPTQLTLYDWQKEIHVESIAKGRGIVQVATGGGKGLLIAHMVAALNVPTLILVHSTSIFAQLADVIKEETGADVGMIGAGICNIKQINVGMVQTLIRAVDPKFQKDWEEDDKTNVDPESIKALLKSVQLLCIDETHRVAAKSSYRVQSECVNAFYRFGYSATPWRADHADMLIEAATGSRIAHYPAKKLTEMGFLAEPVCYFIKFKHKRQPVAMKYGELYKTTIAENDERNKIACFQAAKLASQGKSILMAVTYVLHGETLLQMLQPAFGDKVVFVSGDTQADRRMEVLKKLDKKEILICISTTVFGEGINVPNLDVIINTKAQESSVDAIQLVGRALRVTKTKKKALILDFWDYGCRFFEKHFKARYQMYVEEGGFSPKWIDQADALK